MKKQGKKMKMRLSILLLPGMVVLAGCSNQPDPSVGADKTSVQLRMLPIERWYKQSQVARGNALFQENCASCHKSDASGTPDWRKRDDQGNLPPPPLDGTAHAWHHPLSVLRRTVRVGGVPLGGTMPGFADKLNDQQIENILAWVQSHWPDEIYRVWHERNEQAGKRMQPIDKG